MLFDQGFDLGPEVGVAFALHVAGGEDAVPEGVLGAGGGIFPVVHEVVAEDFGLCGIGGRDAAATVDDALGLIEVDGLGDIVGDDGVVLPEFGHAIDLYGELNWNAFTLQVASQRNRGCGAPALTK